MATSAANAVDDPTQTLQTFSVSDLAQYTREHTFATNASSDFHLFYVGRDDVHDILKYVLSRVSTSLYLNMFGFDDQELNDILMANAKDPNITMLVTLDRSQAGGVHEKAILDADLAGNAAAFNTHFAIGQSATHQISHTKGFVADGRVAGEGSTNWSGAGEGTYIVLGSGASQKPGFKAQNNTQSIITDPDTCARFSAELIAEHLTAASQADGRIPSQAAIAAGLTAPGAKPASRARRAKAPATGAAPARKPARTTRAANAATATSATGQ
jgi:hypothetical protein